MHFPYLFHLSGDKRNVRTDRHLGCLLAFIAGMVNVGGFLAIGSYTSHMTGLLSAMADDLVDGNVSVVLAALSAWGAFLGGAAITALLVNWGRRRKLHSRFALCLQLEAALLLFFGLGGTYLAGMRDLLAPATLLLLCFIMGLQNAIITTVSGAVIRTTHVTGLSTDIGIELGKLIYYNRRQLPELTVTANRQKLQLHSLLVAYFFAGGVCGALGSQHIDFFSATILLSLILGALSIGPVWRDVRILARFYRRK
ncbi:YoaK family protein [Janthinobacterium agaricidamnosum]|uniref:Transmembrane protein n=1 Tax=Janthinobacterium agaricidamnosum NBRC 102515 = DSM 9628 TaxID=1349767 RepID=W0V7W5_9BURK|nr:YoaK family protein [Janthinobacterium agaricidamnosum]CDG84924.1 conserved hypothetical protein [Janthinobacterium agaricidamnosum NBRC 102515 = DSM 9628]